MSNIENSLSKLSSNNYSFETWNNFQIIQRVLEKLDWNSLSSSSFVDEQPDKLIVYLEHVADVRTNIQITVDAYEIIFHLDAMGIHLPGFSREEPDVKNWIPEVLRELLSGDYTVTEFYDAKGVLRKRELTLRSGILPGKRYTNLLGLFSYFIKLEPRIYEGLNLLKETQS